MQKKISPIDPESIFAQDIGLRKFSEASQSSKLGRSEINSLFAAVGSRALSHIGRFSSQNGIFHSNGHNFASNKDFLASPDVLESRRSRLPDAQKISSIRPLGAKCEHVID